MLDTLIDTTRKVGNMFSELTEPENKEVLFLSGNRKIHRIPARVIDLISKLINQPDQVIVGDSGGVDSLLQELLEPSKLTIYFSGYKPRNSVEGATLKAIPASGTGKAYYTHKDIAMTQACSMHIGLVTDFESESGTKANHYRALSLGKPSYLINVNTLEVHDGISLSKP